MKKDTKVTGGLLGGGLIAGLGGLAGLGQAAQYLHSWGRQSGYLSGINAATEAFTAHAPTYLTSRIPKQFKDAEALAQIRSIIAGNVPPGVTEEVKRLPVKAAIAAGAGLSLLVAGTIATTIAINRMINRKSK